MTKETGMATIRIRNIPNSIHQALKIRAIREGVSMEQLVLSGIEKKLKREVVR